MADSEHILSIDTSDRVLGVQIGHGSRRLGRRVIDEPKIHASLLVPTILDLLDEQDLAFSEVAAVAVARGPGSYTGLRIGVSSAKGLAYALGIPLIGIPTMHAMAVANAATGLSTALVTCLSSRKNEIYAQIWDVHEGLRPLTDVVSLSLDDAPSFLLQAGSGTFTATGSGSSDLMASVVATAGVDLAATPSYEDVATVDGVAVLAAERFARREFDDTAQFEPYYLKDFVAKKGASPFTAARNR